MPAAALLAAAPELIKTAKESMAMPVQIAMGVAQLMKAGKQNRTAKRIQGSTVAPTARIGQGALDNYNLAASRASDGLSDRAMLAYENNMDRGLTTSYDAILRGGGDINAISDVYDNYGERAEQLALIDEEIRMKNTQQFMLASERMDEERDKVFMYNEVRPYMDKVRAAEALAADAAQNRSAGMNMIGSAFLNKQTADTMKSDIAGLFGKPQQQAAAPQRINPYLPKGLRDGFGGNLLNQIPTP